jgi:hypothetical protein
VGTSVKTEVLVAVRNPIERFFFKYVYVIIPITYALRVLFELEYMNPKCRPALHDSVKILSELGLLIAFALASTLFGAIGPTISSLFTNGVTSRQAGPESKGDEGQVSCEQQLDTLLNHSARIALGAIAALATLGYYLTRISTPDECRNGTPARFDIALYMVPSVVYACFVGLVAWKVIATSFFFQRFPDRYSVVPRFMHPDRAGGLLPVGGLCLRMMYIAVIPTLLWAAFLFAHVLAPSGIATGLEPNDVLFAFIPLVLLPWIGGLVLGFLPLYRFHVAMISRRREWIEQLAALADKIIAGKLQILEPQGELKSESLETRLKTLSDLESYYSAAQKVHMWPVDTGVLARIWASFVLLAGQVAGLIELARTVSK